MLIRPSCGPTLGPSCGPSLGSLGPPQVPVVPLCRTRAYMRRRPLHGKFETYRDSGTYWDQR